MVGVGISSTALASAQFKATFALSYLSRQPGASTGLTTHMTWSDPGAPGRAPKVISQIESSAIWLARATAAELGQA
jgi:hypothetical protein